MRKTIVIFLFSYFISTSFIFAQPKYMSEINEAVYFQIDKYIKELQKGNYVKALMFIENSYEISIDLELTYEANLSLLFKGQVCNLLGKIEESRSCLQEALDISQKNNFTELNAMSSASLGDIYYYPLCNFSKALSHYKESLHIAKKLNLQSLINSNLSDLGKVYTALGNDERGLAYFEQVLINSENINFITDKISSLINIGDYYLYKGNYDKALSFYENALKLSNDNNLFYSTLINILYLKKIGKVYENLEQYDKALSYYYKLLNTFQESQDWYSLSVISNEIGDIYLHQKKYELAEKMYLKAEELLIRNKMRSRLNSGLVNVFINTDRNQEALKLIEAGYPEWYSSNSFRINFHTLKGKSLKGLGMLKKASDEFLNAISICEEKRTKLNKKTSFSIDVKFIDDIRSYKGLIASLSERLIEQEEEQDFLMDILDSIWSFFKNTLSWIGITDNDEPVIEWDRNKDDIIVDTVFSQYGKDLSSAAFYFSESLKGRILLESITEASRKYNTPELPPDLKEKEQDLINQLSAIENNWEDAYQKGEEAFKELTNRKEKVKKELDSLILVTRKKYPRYSALQYPKPLPPEQLPLKDNEVLLEYAVCDDATYLFVVSKGKVDKIIKISKTKDELEYMVTDFCKQFNKPLQEYSFSIEKGKLLYDFLLSHALEEIPVGSQIIIVPDGFLGALPFEALVINPGEDLKSTIFVDDKWDLTYSQSAAILALNRLLPQAKTEKTLFAIGNPIFNENDPRYIAFKQGNSIPTLESNNLDRYAYECLATRSEWGRTLSNDTLSRAFIYRPLPETEKEIKTIASFFNVQPEPPDILLNVYANETSLKETPLYVYRYLQFATHGDLPGNVQGINEPFILLGQVENKDDDDGFLTLTEVLEMQINAELVVLSACLTGIGKVIEGEGVMNFARAFQQAGARSVVVSLWSVYSYETVEHMELFYKHLSEGKGKIESFSLARKEMKSKHPDPIYWAPFVLYGER